MKINTEIKEVEKGLVFKKKAYTLVLDIQFSEEERAQINALGLTKDYDKNTLVEGLRGLRREITISWLMDGVFEVPELEDLPYAKKVEAATIQGLKDLKAYITANSETGKKSLEI